VPTSNTAGKTLNPLRAIAQGFPYLSGNSQLNVTKNLRIKKEILSRMTGVGTNQRGHSLTPMLIENTLLKLNEPLDRSIGNSTLVAPHSNKARF
jgi:hypothetical protein